MNAKLRSTSSVVVVLVLVLAGALVQPFWGTQPPSRTVRARLQGTWRVQINPTNCQTGAPLPSFSAVVSYARGGTLTEVINSQAFLPGQVTPGLGVWSHTQADAYKAVWEVFILFDTPPTVPGFPFKRGVQRLMRDIEVDGDQMTFNASSQFFDSNGNPLFATCASGTGTRFEGGQDED
jgi:hypothetical protein